MNLAINDSRLTKPGPQHAALRDYENVRLRLGAAVIARARHLGAYMQAQIKTASERQMAERYRTPEAVMRETGTPPAMWSTNPA